ncbi:MAG: TIGR02099 family protein [Hydrogenophilales bacterium 16-64-46]|nr:MAG: TIGR02099 family protein [Hydrogenophilales bacterium 12-64-13]OYZ06206.1 MAG: TIGR02099 family protein [Hydrogenophilales bacterium 16-64-46]OZA38895.1 MAG: TIGR02099 family protein [Hydrogenophilales bacterium 17-64-34]HQS99459.1 YhdP family protein [Thiobacillus sp.]
MNLFPALKTLPRRVLRVAFGLAALAATVFAVAAAVMFFWVLPNVSDHRDTVEDLMSRALGQRVTLDAVSGVWQQMRPEFRLEGVRIHDAQNRVALVLPRLDAAFAWRSLLFLEPRFNRIELAGLTLGVRRARDGRIDVGGIPVNPAAPDSRLAEWLLRQGRVHIAGASVVWRDEMRAAPPLVFTGVDLLLENGRIEHRLSGRAVPPAALARPVVVEADLEARDISDARTWNGQVAVEAAGVAFARLKPWMSLPGQPESGWGAVRATLDIEAGVLRSAGAGVDMRGVSLPLAAGRPPLRLGQVRGQVLWQREAKGQRLDFQNLRVAFPGGASGAPFDLGLSWQGATRELRARAVSLAGWQAVLPSLPLDDALRARLARLDPGGRVDLLRLGWQGAHPALDNFSLDARVSGLQVTAEGQQPGVSGLSGQFEGDARGGRFTIESRQFALDLPDVMREPALRFDEFHATGQWRKTAQGHRFSLDTAKFANTDLAGGLRGHYDWVPGTPGAIELEGALTRIDGRAVWRYFPWKVGQHTVDWAKQGVVAARSDDVRFTLRGELARFPFEHGEGQFRVEAVVKDGVLRYAPGWPVMEDVNVRLVFAGKTMEIVSERARIYDVELAPVRAFIADLIHREEILQVSGEARGSTRDFIRFANFSPVSDRLRGFTDALDGSGTMKLAMNLRVPLRHSRDATLAGRLSFEGGTLYPEALPRLEQVRGEIEFTQDTLAAQGISARFLGGPLRLDAQTRAGQVRLTLLGRATATGLTPWVGAAVGARLSGQTGWRGQIDFEPGGERVRVESDLVGLASTLPAPLAKSAPQALPLLASAQPLGEATLHEVRLGRTVGALWRSDAGARFDRGEIRFGGMAVMPGEPGLRLAGNAAGLDISGWLGLLPQGGEDAAIPVSVIDLGFDAFDLMGRRFREVRVQGRTRNGLLRTQVSAQGVTGTLTYRPAGEQAARLSGQFRLLVIPAPAPAGAGEPVQALKLRAGDFPVLDLTVDDFRLQDRPFGRLQVVARGVTQGLAIDTLELTHPDSVLHMSGLWRDTGVGETRADLKLSVLDAGKFLARFGYPDTLKRGRAEVAGNAAWEGSPADFAFATLAGQLDFQARSGQFLKVEPGAGKLLGVLSLQSLPRRLNFDFRDIFNSGFAFDDINATLRIARGVVYSDDLRMRGPAAKVNMSGLADLGRESVQLRVKVIPKLSESVAVAGALLGGPIAGVGALAAQKLLRDPVEEAISQEYTVTGPWQAPDVKRLSKKANKQEPQP